MPMMRILSITLLLLSGCLLSQCSPNRRLVKKTVSPCCTEVTTTDISSEVTGDTYAEQSAWHSCVEAVIFNTQEGRKVCVDPKAEWVQNLIVSMKKTRL